jgi:hypothetical protein
MKKILALVLVFSFLSIGIVFAQNSKTEVIVDGIDISGLNPENQAHFLKLRKIAIEESQKRVSEDTKNKIGNIISNPSNIDLAIQWRTLIVTTLRETASDLNVAVNEFVKTPVGGATAIILFYNLMGKTLLHSLWTIAFLPIAWLIYTFICGFLFFYFHGKKKIKTEITKKGSDEIKKTFEYIPKYEFYSREAKAFSIVSLTVPWGILTIVSICMIAGAF